MGVISGGPGDTFAPPPPWKLAFTIFYMRLPLHVVICICLLLKFAIICLTPLEQNPEINPDEKIIGLFQ